MKPKRAKDDESALFREAVRGVRPLVHDRHEATGRRAAGRRRVQPETIEPSGPAGRDETDARHLAGEPLNFHRPGVPATVLRKLRRAQYRVQAELDLHGLPVAQARSALREFLQDARSRHLHCVRIIHGKGLRSGERGPVLKSLVNTTLTQSPGVLAFASAPPHKGGTGVLHVLLDDVVP